MGSTRGSVTGGRGSTGGDAETTADGLEIGGVVTVGVGGLLVLVGVAAPLVAGPEGEFLVFGRNYLHDAIHVATGAVALGAGLLAGGRYANATAAVLGAAYLVVAVIGVVFIGVLSSLINLNVADNALHLLLAVLLLGVGVIFGLAAE